MTPEQEQQIKQKQLAAKIKLAEQKVASFSAPSVETPSSPSLLQQAYDWATTRPDGTQTSLGQIATDIPMGIGRAYTGLVDLLALPARKALTAVTGEAPPTPTYTERLEQLAGMVGVPSEETPLQRAISYMAPSPGTKKAELLADALMGGVAYAGEQYGGTPGAILAPLLVTGAGPASRKLGEVTGIITGRPQVMQDIAQKEIEQFLGPEGTQRILEAQKAKQLLSEEGVLQFITPEGLKRIDEAKKADEALSAEELMKFITPEGKSKIRAAQRGPQMLSPLGLQKSAAEIAQTPSAAAYEVAMSKEPISGNMLVESLKQREAAAKTALETLGPKSDALTLGAALKGDLSRVEAEKAANIAKLEEGLGISPDIMVTQPIRGETLRNLTLDQFNKADEAVNSLWNQISPRTTVKMESGLKSVTKFYDNLEKLTKQRISGATKELINTIKPYAEIKAPRISLGTYQSLRRALGEEWNIASRAGKNTDAALLMDMRNELDDLFTKAVETQGGAKAGELQILRSAIAGTRELKQTFNKGVVGQILKKRGEDYSVAASNILKSIDKTPENVQEIMLKFGRDSDIASEVRDAYLGKLAGSADPTEFLIKNEDKYKAIFEDDFYKLVDYAQKKGTVDEFASYGKLLEQNIPSKLLGNQADLEKFVKRFSKDEFMMNNLRGKFVESLGKNPNNFGNVFESKKPFAEKIFNKQQMQEFPKIFADIKSQKSVSELAAKASRGQSITAAGNTVLARIINGRALINTMKQGTLFGAIGSAGAKSGIAATLINMTAAFKLQQLGVKREEQLNQIIGEMLKDPNLLDLAKAPPTKTNFAKLAEELGRRGYISSQEDTE